MGARPAYVEDVEGDSDNNKTVRGTRVSASSTTSSDKKEKKRSSREKRPSKEKKSHSDTGYSSLHVLTSPDESSTVKQVRVIPERDARESRRKSTPVVAAGAKSPRKSSRPPSHRSVKFDKKDLPSRPKDRDDPRYFGERGGHPVVIQTNPTPRAPAPSAPSQARPPRPTSYHAGQPPFLVNRPPLSNSAYFPQSYTMPNMAQPPFPNPMQASYDYFPEQPSSPSRNSLLDRFGRTGAPARPSSAMGYTTSNQRLINEDSGSDYESAEEEQPTRTDRMRETKRRSKQLEDTAAMPPPQTYRRGSVRQPFEKPIFIEDSRDNDGGRSRDLGQRPSRDFDDRLSTRDYDDHPPRNFDDRPFPFRPSRDLDQRPSQDFDRPSRDLDHRSSRDFERPSRDLDHRPSRDFDRPSQDFDDRKSRDYDDQPSRDYDDRKSQDADERKTRPKIMYRDTAPLPQRPRRQSVPRAPPSIDSSSFDYDKGNAKIRVETRDGRHNSYYDGGTTMSSNYEEQVRDATGYQNEVSGGEPIKLTADILRKQQNTIASSRSTRSSESRDGSDFKRSVTTRTTRSGSGPEADDVTIRIKGNATVNIAGAEITNADGVELSISRRKSIRNGSEASRSEYAPSQAPSQVPSSHAPSAADERRGKYGRITNHARSASQSVKSRRAY